MNIDFEKGMTHFSTLFAEQGDKPSSYDSAIERLKAVEIDVDATEKTGIFIPLPDSGSDASKDSSRIKTIRNRLFILGYLEKDNGRDNLDVTLKEAIRKFQKEAGLNPDGWVGEKETWPALQELVSFETPLNLRQWYGSTVPKPALKRAIALRLFVLGLRERKPTSPDDDIETGLQKFGRIWNILSFGDIQSKPGLNREWVEILFDMDNLTDKLSRVSAPLDRKHLEEAHSFILNSAKTELWLMGYSVRPSGYDLVKSKIPPTESDGLSGTDIWMKSKTVTQYCAVKKRIKFHKALHKFWIEHGKTDKNADEDSVNFLNNFPSFFQIIDEGLQTHRNTSDVSRQEALEEIIKDRREQIPLIWQKLRNIGARIWDGVRRVWSWFKRIANVAKEKVLGIGNNLSRLIYDFASGSFKLVSNVFKSFRTTIDVVTKPIMPGSSEEQVIFYRDLDFDSKVVISSSADGQQVANCCQNLLRTSRLFAFGCRVVGTFVSILIDVFKTGWTAYFGLILALIRFRRVKQEFESLAAEYKEIFPL